MNNRTAQYTAVVLATLVAGAALTLWGAYTGDQRTGMLIIALAATVASLAIYLRVNDIPNTEVIKPRSFGIYMAAFAWTRIGPWSHLHLHEYLYYGICLVLTLIIGLFLHKGMASEQETAVTREAPTAS
ncbi:hypothetical protein [Nesterenkonia suensis]